MSLVEGSCRSTHSHAEPQTRGIFAIYFSVRYLAGMIEYGDF